MHYQSYPSIFYNTRTASPATPANAAPAIECLLAPLLLVAAAAESVPVAEVELELDVVECAGDVWLASAVTPSHARMHLDMVSYASVSVRSSG